VINVAIIGVGLIGGSLGEALRRTGRYRVLGVARRAVTLREGKRFGAFDEGTLDPIRAAECSIIVLATPVAEILRVIPQLLPKLKPGTVLTDVGSVKGVIAEGMRRIKLPRGVDFVGAHPLAGSHKTGVSAARPDLFKDSTCVILGPRSPAQRRIITLWKAVGSRPVQMDAKTHDEAVALTSHLPHLLAHALVQTTAERHNWRQLRELVAGSFRDATRVAASDPDQWAEIFRTNAAALRKAVGDFSRTLDRLEKTVSRPSAAEALRSSSKLRTSLFENR
jgi:prephenate dehydrogenase